MSDLQYQFYQREKQGGYHKGFRVYLRTAFGWFVNDCLLQIWYFFDHYPLLKRTIRKHFVICPGNREVIAPPPFVAESILPFHREHPVNLSRRLYIAATQNSAEDLQAPEDRKDQAPEGQEDQGPKQHPAPQDREGQAPKEQADRPPRAKDTARLQEAAEAAEAQRVVRDRRLPRPPKPRIEGPVLCEIREVAEVSQPRVLRSMKGRRI